MLHLIEPCRIDICRGIEAYQDLFDDSHAILPHRSDDIIELFTILKRPYTSITNLLKAIDIKLAEMKTGWWIFQTGHSRLKNNIIPVIAKYRLLQSETLHADNVLSINDTEKSKTSYTHFTAQLTAGLVKSAARTIPSQSHLMISREEDIESVARETSYVASRENTASQELNSIPTADTSTNSLFTLKH